MSATQHDVAPLSLLALLGFAVAGINQLGNWLLSQWPWLYAISPASAAEWIQVCNTALITLGSTAILLYQRARSKRYAVDAQRYAEERMEMMRRLDALAARMDRYALDNDRIHADIRQLACHTRTQGPAHESHQ